MLSLLSGHAYLGALRLYQCFPLLMPVLLFKNAPHGRFSPSNKQKPARWYERLTVDGTSSWIIMELVSPIALLSMYLASPTSKSHQLPTIIHPSTLLVGLWVMHYFNRAIVSPLRTPSRSPSHILIPLAAAAFNLLNGSLNGSWLSSGVVKPDGWNSLGFWASIGLFISGWIGNVVHDEVLLNIRKESKGGGQDGKPKYGIPHGYFYRFVS
ncbi:hypothetical protein M407DRAFT_113659 [Tulasnella calospora MUT 4182]|uniref:3-oxo-5-alpha-steroid 4-dehydrogenase C-terminal domain-containing protein n=1 Tax=Tulasnella calospora MUT 4182 TaxID=1051891 RepID=A0A0C3LNW3_9AGAM|nr:hypothetical protein M407DRAFT_113659 [Tulasnella calospora MUT 4182]